MICFLDRMTLLRFNGLKRFHIERRVKMNKIEVLTNLGITLLINKDKDFDLNT